MTVDVIESTPPKQNDMNATPDSKEKDENTVNKYKEEQELENQNEQTDDNADMLSKATGEFGLWQTFIFFAIVVPVKMCGTWTLLGIVFLAPKTTFKCIQLLNSTEETNNSTCYHDCIKYEYYSDFENTIIKQWDLICDRAWLSNLSQTVCMFGALVGSMVLGFVSDRYGRRIALLSTCALHLIASVITPFTTVFWGFLILRFILGAAAANLTVIPFVLFIEIVGPNKRELANTIFHIPIPLGQAVMPAFAYYLRSWDKFSIGVTVPSFLFLTYYFFLPESPKWLLSMDKVEEAATVMKTAAKWNGLPTENISDTANAIARANEKDRKPDTQKTSYLDLVTIPSLRINNLLSCLCWFGLGLSFYGSNQYIGQTSSNSFLSIALAGIAEIPGVLLSCYLLKRIGRRRTAVSCAAVCALSNGLLALPDDYFYAKLVAGTVGVSCAGAAFATMYIFTTELFPTVARNMGMGASSTASRVGSTLAPFVAGLALDAPWAPAVVFCAVTIMVSAVCLCLPETKGKELADHIR